MTPFPESDTTINPFNRNSGRTAPLMVHDCVLVASRVFGVSVEDIKGAKRDRDIARARQAAMWAARDYTAKSMPQIGKAFGRDHTTVLYACRQIENLRKIRQGAYRQLTGAMRRELDGLQAEILGNAGAW